MFKKLKSFFKKHPLLVRYYKIVISAIKSFSDHEISSMGAELAYYSIVAFFTLGVTIVYISSIVPFLSEGALYAVENLFPASITDLFYSIIKQIYIPNKTVTLISTSFMSIWFASRAIRSMMSSFDSIFSAKENRKPYQRTYLAILFTLVFEFLFATIFTFSVLGKPITLSILNPLQLSSQFLFVWNFLRLFFPSILMLFTFWFFYFYLTNVKIKFKHAFPGAVFTTVLWLIIAKFFSLYFSKISLLPVVLGSVGGIFVFLIWIYWCSIIVLVGAVLNYRFMLWRKYLAKKDMTKQLSEGR
jgi:membrane protein